jgi:hypothetical protein
MSIPGSANPLLLTSAVAGGYFVSRSVRLNSADSAYFSRTPASSGNRKTWTWAGWVKRASLNTGTNQVIFSGGITASDTGYTQIDLAGTNTIRVTGQNTDFIISTAVFRDPSAWYHLHVAFDSTQGTNANKLKVYVNGAEIAYGTDNRGSISNQDYGINQAAAHAIGRNSQNSARYLDGYLADIHFIDGQALDPTSFGEFDDNGIWQPKAYTGTYGTNGFQLKFEDNSSNTATTLGKDTSGNGNNWTPNNLSVTAGAGNDSVVDVPTNGAQTDTGAGGEVRGNYCTWNPLSPGVSAITNGNLDCTVGTAGDKSGTVRVSSGSWYWEVTPTNINGGGGAGAAIIAVGTSGTGWVGYNSNGARWESGGSQFGYGAAYTTNDVIGVSLNADTGTIVFYKNGVSNGTAWSGLTGPFTPYVTLSWQATSITYTANFGQRPFAYTAPSGFKALNTANLPSPQVTKPSEVFTTYLYTGNGSQSGRSLTGVGFSPDLAWVKDRSAANWHQLRSTLQNGIMHSNDTGAEQSSNANGVISSLDSDGFSLSTSTNTPVLNTNNNAYVAWLWDAGSSTVTNTQGSISSQVRANASAGFSIVTYTGTGSSATIGHGLGVAPQFFLIKRRNATSSWIAWHTSIGNSDILRLESTNATQTISGFWQNTRPTSSLIYLDADGTVNGSGGTYVAYCFAPVAGYSSFGSYAAGTDPFVYLGFRPAFLMVKRSNGTENWNIVDYRRNGVGNANVVTYSLQPNSSGAEYQAEPGIDLLSNGFKLRGSFNTGGATYIYAAFAEHPFQYARAR